MRGLSLVAASGGHSSSRCTGLSLSRPLLLRSTGSRRAGSAVVAHGPSRSVACGIFPDQGSNPCPLHWQADSQPLLHQGSHYIPFLLHCAAFWLASSVLFSSSLIVCVCVCVCVCVVSSLGINPICWVLFRIWVKVSHANQIYSEFRYLVLR